MQRRAFLHCVPLLTTRGWAGANDRIRVALIGAGGRGRDLLHFASAVKGVEIAAICDPDEERMRKMGAEATSRAGWSPLLEPDMRRVLERKDIDAVAIATCNHWHALATVWALQSGKHVYVEKPVSHTAVEGQKMVEAAQRYGRVVQGGLQRRSSPRFRHAMSLLHSGLAGDLHMARWVFTRPREPIGFQALEPPPTGLHWDLWLGPAPAQPFHRNLVHYNWHWFWDFGNGELGNNGVHLMDLARWGLGKGLPARIVSTGGRYGTRDQGQTPNEQTAAFVYADGTQIVCESHGLSPGLPPAVWFYGSKATVELDLEGNMRIWGSGKQPERVAQPGSDGLESDHFQNFIDAIRATKADALNCGIQEAECSTMLAHLANISCRLRSELRFDAASRKFVSNSEADALLGRTDREPFALPRRV